MKSINIPFSGLYESFHSEDLENELSSAFSNDNGDVNQELLDEAYRLIDWRAAHLAYAQLYVSQFMELADLPSLIFEELDSPREYNFTTDRIFCRISDADIQKMFDKTDTSVLNNLAREMFTSRTGFSSFYSPLVETWGALETWDANQLGCLLQAYMDTEQPSSESGAFDSWAEMWMMSDCGGNGSYDAVLWGAVDSAKSASLFERLDAWREATK